MAFYDCVQTLYIYSSKNSTNYTIRPTRTPPPLKKIEIIKPDLDDSQE